MMVSRKVHETFPGTRLSQTLTVTRGRQGGKTNSWGSLVNHDGPLPSDGDRSGPSLPRTYFLSLSWAAASAGAALEALIISWVAMTICWVTLTMLLVASTILSMAALSSSLLGVAS